MMCRLAIVTALCQWKGRGLKFNLWVYISSQFSNRFWGFRSNKPAYPFGPRFYPHPRFAYSLNSSISAIFGPSGVADWPSISDSARYAPSSSSPSSAPWGILAPGSAAPVSYTHLGKAAGSAAWLGPIGWLGRDEPLWLGESTVDDEFDSSDGFFWHPVSRAKRRNTKGKRIAIFFINERYTCIPATFNVGVAQ